MNRYEGRIKNTCTHQGGCIVENVWHVETDLVKKVVKGENIMHNHFDHHCPESTHYTWANAAYDLWDEWRHGFTTFDLSRKGQDVFKFLTARDKVHNGKPTT